METHRIKKEPAQAIHILIVEDKTSIAQTLIRILQREFGTQAEVSSCRLAEDALLELNTESVDLLITDWELPKMSGSDLIIQARQLFPNLKIIFMTGNPSAQIEADVKGYADAYFTKPFRLPDLVHRIHELI